MELSTPTTLEEWNVSGADYLPGLLGMSFLLVEPTEVKASLVVDKKLRAWNGFFHAGAVVALADTCCGYGTVRSLPKDATGFTTIELKSNFLSTARDGKVICVAKPLHQGRTTQVWDATVTTDDEKKVLAQFRCTQMVLRKS